MRYFIYYFYRFNGILQMIPSYRHAPKYLNLALGSASIAITI